MELDGHPTLAAGSYVAQTPSADVHYPSVCLCCTACLLLHEDRSQASSIALQLFRLKSNVNFLYVCYVYMYYTEFLTVFNFYVMCILFLFSPVEVSRCNCDNGIGSVFRPRGTVHLHRCDVHATLSVPLLFTSCNMKSRAPIWLHRWLSLHD